MLIIKSKDGDEMSIDMKSIECLSILYPTCAAYPCKLSITTKSGFKVNIYEPKYQNDGERVDIESLSSFVMHESDVVMINVSAIHNI